MTQAEIAAAKHWFRSRNFSTVCDLAGVDGGWILRGIRKSFPEAGIE